MKYCNLFFIPFLIIIFSCRENPETKIDLYGFEWSLTSVDSSIMLKSVNPTDVHMALMEAGVIPDPFYQDHEKELQWIGQYDWKFETRFNLDDAFLKHEHIELVFEGLDTYAEVVINDSLVLSADNMFRTWYLEVGPLLKRRNNKLSVYFASPEKRNETKQKQLHYTLPEKRGFTRKAAYQFGWDWSPAFVTSGIWKPAYLKAWNGAVIKDVYQSSFEIKDNEANIILETEVETTTEKQYQLQVFINFSEVPEEVEEEPEVVEEEEHDQHVDPPVDLLEGAQRPAVHAGQPAGDEGADRHVAVDLARDHHPRAVHQKVGDAEHRDHAQDQCRVAADVDQAGLDHDAPEEGPDHDHQHDAVGHVEHGLEGGVDGVAEQQIVGEGGDQAPDQQLRGPQRDDQKAPEDEQVVPAGHLPGHRALEQEVDQHVAQAGTFLVEGAVEGLAALHEAVEAAQTPEEDGEGDEDNDAEYDLFHHGYGPSFESRKMTGWSGVTMTHCIIVVK